MSHKTLLMLTHLYYFFNNVALIKGCVIAPNLVYTHFFHLLSEGFVNIQTWINHKSLPEGGQRLYSKNFTAQGKKLILRRN